MQGYGEGTENYREHIRMLEAQLAIRDRLAEQVERDHEYEVGMLYAEFSASMYPQIMGAA